MKTNINDLPKCENSKIYRNIYDVKAKYINSEYDNWKFAMNTLNAEDKFAILSAIFTKIFIGKWNSANMLTSKQKIFFHAGIQLFEMKEQNDKKRK